MTDIEDLMRGESLLDIGRWALDRKHKVVIHFRGGSTAKGCIIKVGSDFLILSPSGPDSALSERPWEGLIIPIAAIEHIRVRLQ